MMMFGVVTSDSFEFPEGVLSFGSLASILGFACLFLTLPILVFGLLVSFVSLFAFVAVSVLCLSSFC